MNEFTVTVTCNRQEAQDLKDKFRERANVKPDLLLLQPNADKAATPVEPTLAGVKPQEPKVDRDPTADPDWQRR